MMIINLFMTNGRLDPAKTYLGGMVIGMLLGATVTKLIEMLL